MSEETVKDYYKQKERCKISLNDQLDDFYEGCKNNTIRRECAYYFHAERLNPEEVTESQKKYEKFRSHQMRNRYGAIVPKQLPPWVKIKSIKYGGIRTKKTSVMLFADGTLTRVRKVRPSEAKARKPI